MTISKSSKSSTLNQTIQRDLTFRMEGLSSKRRICLYRGNEWTFWWLLIFKKDMFSNFQECWYITVYQQGKCFIFFKKSTTNIWRTTIIIKKYYRRVIFRVVIYQFLLVISTRLLANQRSEFTNTILLIDI